MHPDVEGYGVISEGETYHPSAFFDPADKFKYAGDIEAASEKVEADFEAKNVEVTVAPAVNVEVPSNPSEAINEQTNVDPAFATLKVDTPLSGDEVALATNLKTVGVTVTSVNRDGDSTDTTTPVAFEEPVVKEAETDVALDPTGSVVSDTSTSSEPTDIDESRVDESNDPVDLSTPDSDSDSVSFK